MRDNTAATVGDCPVCGTGVPRIDVLIEYGTDTGPAAYAECPGCREVVDPLRS
jgi:endogenous inhibitor of DNA gyrase (YacG/DUF329 family)